MQATDRRTWLILLALGGAGLPLSAPAQPVAKVYRIGYLSAASEEAQRASRESFLRALAEHGWVEGRNLAVESRFANGVAEALSRLAAELARARVDVIVTTAGSTTALAAKRATDRIPIVFTSGGDPVEIGIVSNLARPDANVTGIGGDLTVVAKRLEALRDVTPKATRYGVLVNPNNRVHATIVRTLEATAARLKIALQPIPVRDPSGFEAAWVVIKRDGLGGVLMLGDAMFQTHGKRLVALAAEARLPMVFATSQLVRDGGLMSFALDVSSLQRQAAEMVDRILRGAVPSEIPIEEPRKFEMVINLKTAEAIGLTIPQSVLLMADEVLR
jgi:putative ABC transport system substrate-binding protein